jgi:hypothetical protein
VDRNRGTIWTRTFFFLSQQVYYICKILSSQYMCKTNHQASH